MSFLINCTNEQINITQTCIKGTSPIVTHLISVGVVIIIILIMVFTVSYMLIKKSGGLQ